MESCRVCCRNRSDVDHRSVALLVSFGTFWWLYFPLPPPKFQLLRSLSLSVSPSVITMDLMQRAGNAGDRHPVGGMSK